VPGNPRADPSLVPLHQIASLVHLPQTGRVRPHSSGYSSPGARTLGELTGSGVTDISGWNAPPECTRKPRTSRPVAVPDCGLTLRGGMASPGPAGRLRYRSIKPED